MKKLFISFFFAFFLWGSIQAQSIDWSKLDAANDHALLIHTKGIEDHESMHDARMAMFSVSQSELVGYLQVSPVYFVMAVRSKNADVIAKVKNEIKTIFPNDDELQIIDKTVEELRQEYGE